MKVQHEPLRVSRKSLPSLAEALSAQELRQAHPAQEGTSELK
jgi:hypothetical protein